MIPDLMHMSVRLKRYEICAPLEYRIRGQRRWHKGVSRNMSESGLLFEGSTPLELGMRLEMHLLLRPLPGACSESSIRFQGTVVRSSAEGLWAARISSRRLQKARSDRSAGRRTDSLELAPRATAGISGRRPVRYAPITGEARRFVASA